jgi:DUF4097 and DUF4098 domain-containing protein YvlB
MHKLVLFCLALLPATLFAQQNFSETLDLNDKDIVLIELDCGGSITLEGWDSPTAQIDYRVLGSPEIDIEETSNGFRFRAKGNNRGRRETVNLVIKMNRKANVELDTSGGNVALTGLEGRYEGRTMGGRIEIEDVQGFVDLKTMGGNIDVKDSALEGKLNTMGGNINLDNVDGNVSTKTMGGNVRFNNPGGRSTVTEVVNITTMGGEIEVKEAPLGAKLKTMGGNIEVDNAGQFVSAKTMGGDIDVKAIDGWAEVSTMGGDIFVEMTGDPSVGDRHIDLDSKGGRITLVLPADISADFDVSLYYDDKGRKPEIQSDFPLNITTETKSGFWSDSKVDRGTGAVKGGKHTISIKTVGGDIVIRKK